MDDPGFFVFVWFFFTLMFPFILYVSECHFYILHAAIFDHISSQTLIPERLPASPHAAPPLKRTSPLECDQTYFSSDSLYPLREHRTKSSKFYPSEVTFKQIQSIDLSWFERFENRKVNEISAAGFKSLEKTFSASWESLPSVITSLERVSTSASLVSGVCLGFLSRRWSVSETSSRGFSGSEWRWFWKQRKRKSPESDSEI